jgi:hypothetical protein
MITRLVFSLVLPPLVWLICGWPSLHLAGNQALLGVLLAHTYVVIWQGPLFKALRGDDFTYGAVTLGLNIVSLLVTVVTTVGMFVVYGGDITHVGDVPKPVWGVIGLSLLLTIALPLLAGRAAAPLPQASDRRTYEDPTNGQ